MPTNAKPAWTPEDEVILAELTSRKQAFEEFTLAGVMRIIDKFYYAGMTPRELSEHIITNSEKLVTILNLKELKDASRS